MDEESRLPEKEPKRSFIIQFIATAVILIVAFCLMGILYMMASVPITDSYYTPAGIWNEMEATSPTEGYLEFGGFTSDLKPMDLRIHIYANYSDIGYLTFTSNTAYPPQNMTWTNGPDGANASYTDYHPLYGTIDSGDNIKLTGLTPNTEYSFELFHLLSDSTISIANPDSFTTEP